MQHTLRANPLSLTWGESWPALFDAFACIACIRESDILAARQLLPLPVDRDNVESSAGSLVCRADAAFERFGETIDVCTSAGQA